MAGKNLRKESPASPTPDVDDVINEPHAQRCSYQCSALTHPWSD